MKIKIIESGGYMHGAHKLEEGNIYPVPDEVGRVLCEAGMAEDTEGEVETGDRDVNARYVISVESSNQKQTAEDVNNG